MTAAYTNAENEVPVFFEQSEGHQTRSGEWICEGVKSLYGQRNAGFCWQKHLIKQLGKVNCEAIPVDPSLYMLREGNAWCLMATYVDDIFPLFNKEGRYLRDRCWKALCTDDMQMTNEGELTWALNTKIDRDKENGILKISQEAFVYEVMARFGMLNIKGANTPADPRVELPHPDVVSDEEVNEMSDKPVRELVGCLLWLTMISRPDIEVAVHTASRVQHRPSKALWAWYAFYGISRIIRTMGWCLFAQKT